MCDVLVCFWWRVVSGFCSQIQRMSSKLVQKVLKKFHLPDLFSYQFILGVTSAYQTLRVPVFICRNEHVSEAQTNSISSERGCFANSFVVSQPKQVAAVYNQAKKKQ